MDLKQLYEGTPVAQHGEIQVVGDRVLVRDAGGDITEYVLQGKGELWMVRDRELANLRTVLAAIKADLNKIKSKLGVV